MPRVSEDASAAHAGARLPLPDDGEQLRLFEVMDLWWVSVEPYPCAPWEGYSAYTPCEVLAWERGLATYRYPEWVPPES